MDDSRFDMLTRSLIGSRTRRGTLGALLGGTLGSLGVKATEGKKKKKKKKKKKATTVPPAGSGTGSGTGSPPPPCVPNCPAGTVCGSDGCDGVCGVCAGTDHCSDGICCPQDKQKSCGTDPRTQAEVCDCCGQGQHLSCEFDSAMQLLDCRCCDNGSNLCGGACCPQGGPFPTCFMCIDTPEGPECGCFG